MLDVAVTVCERGYCKLNTAFRHVSPGITYSAERARRNFLQMPLASVRIGKPCDGKSFTVLVESFPGIENSTISNLLNGLVEVSKMHNPRHLESRVKMLLGLARSDRERETLRYAIFKASGVSQTEARRQYGFEGMTARAAKVEEALAEIEQIREAIEGLARIQDKALLSTFGIVDAFSSSDESCSDEEEIDVDSPEEGESDLPRETSSLHPTHQDWAPDSSQRDKPPYMAEPEASLRPSERDKAPYMAEPEASLRLSQRDKPPYMAEPEASLRPSQRDKPPYMAEPEASLIPSQRDKPPYMAEPEESLRPSQRDKPPYMAEPEASLRPSQRDKPPYMAEPEASLRPSQRDKPPFLTNEADMPSDSTVKVILQESHCNWFEFRDRLTELLPNLSESQQDALLQKIYAQVSLLDFSSAESELIEQSYLAVEAAKADQAEDERLACALNGDIVTESESDNPEEYTQIKDPLSEAGRKVVLKRRAAIRRRAQRLKAKAIAEKRFLSRKYTKHSSRMLQECPGIGKTIEAFVEERNVGADHWRRTGVLTFDGNARLDKVTYDRIRRHLEKVYNRHFAYGTVVELCVTRNRRRRSALRYRGLAKVTTRRARKGFNVRYNTDTHWSSAFYKGLNDMQLRDGRALTVLNRDDASGFRLDTLVTCKQYATPAVQGHDITTTRCDYVNKYPSVLQTTSYNFPATRTTAEICAGVVKAPGIFPKNPAQHAADLAMLEQELAAAFEDQDGNPTPIDCIRVDGATDEGPSHEEVQFWWTRRHLLRSKVATLVTTRSSGSRYLNRVELQNGCLSLGHSNTFIPSTLAGSCIDPQTGVINQSKLKENLDLAIEAYLSRVNGCPCGTTTISLYKGANSSHNQLMRDKLLIFLKGTKKAKQALQKDDPHLFSEFQTIWGIRNRHMVPGLPTQYIFFLLCCYKSDCPHPRCQAGQPDLPYLWYPQGPPITKLPLPTTDPKRRRGSTVCTTCKRFCSGHYSPPTYIDVTKPEPASFAKPPSYALKELFLQGENITDDFVQSAAQSTLLSPEESRIWLEHLQVVVENRRRGAAKAALTRKARRNAADARSSDESFCGVCKGQYLVETEEMELWIACDRCNTWFHCSCPPAENEYICRRCQSQ